MLANVILYGNLAKKFGKEHKLDINTPAEAIRALCNLYPKFKETIRDQHIRIVANNNNINNLTELHMGYNKTIKIIPVPAGGKSSLIGAFLGAALIGAAFWTGGTSLATWGAWQVGMAMTGAGMILGSVAALLTPMPTMPDYSLRERADERPSYVYNGPTNTTEQGGPVPLIYGRYIVGSTVIAVDVNVED